MNDPAFLEQHALESPLSYSRPYCQLEDAPKPIGFRCATDPLIVNRRSLMGI
jgi:hypothetical protein